MADLVTITEAKRALNMSATSSANDAELETVLAAAIEQVEAYVGPLAPREVVETHRSPGEAISLRQTPVISVESVVSLAGGPSLYEPAQLLVDPVSGVLRPLYGDTFGSFDAGWGGVTISYTAGREAGQIPESINRAILIVTEHLWETQRGWASAPSWRGESAPAPEGESSRPMGFALPSRAIQLLEPHMKIVVA